MITEVYQLTENLIAGTYEWAVFLTVEDAQAAAEQHFAPNLRWGAFEYDSSTRADTMSDSSRRYLILRVPIGQFLEDERA